MSASSARTAARSIGSSLSRGSNSRSSSSPPRRRAGRRRGRERPVVESSPRSKGSRGGVGHARGTAVYVVRRHLRPDPSAPAGVGLSPDGRRRRRTAPGSARLPSSRPTPGATSYVVRVARTVTQNCPCALPRLCGRPPAPPFRTPAVTPTAGRYPEPGQDAPSSAERVHRGLVRRGVPGRAGSVGRPGTMIPMTAVEGERAAGPPIDDQAAAPAQPSRPARECRRPGRSRTESRSRTPSRSVPLTTSSRHRRPSPRRGAVAGRRGRTPPPTDDDG